MKKTSDPKLTYLGIKVLQLTFEVVNFGYVMSYLSSYSL